MSNSQWQFWIDRGGTFTDVIGVDPEGNIHLTKMLSENPEQYQDAAIAGIRKLMGDQAQGLGVVKMGTTVATNALLERKGEPLVLVTNRGFRDGLRIGYQHRPDIFALDIQLPEQLYGKVLEVAGRLNAQGEVIEPLDLDQVRQDLQRIYDLGIRVCAIVLLHSYRSGAQELAIGAVAEAIGFTQISLSHQVSPTMKLVSRGNTTVVDAYLSPVLRQYVEQVASQLPPGCELLFMQSNGGLVPAANFQGKDAILSGPAGGIVGAVKTSAVAGFHKIIGFDMGGTSTDVSHYAHEYERTLETEVAGVRIKTPMMAINTVAAGGGSILSFDGTRYQVGPESAGANPGPACYDRGGPLTVTDANVMVGKIQPQCFPKVFGPQGNQPLNKAILADKFKQLVPHQPPEVVAAGFLAIAVDNMASAIKKISLERGYDLAEYALCCFGGAGGQHACLIADALGMNQIVIHPYAGVLSAYGIGLADLRVLKEQTLELPLTPEHLATIDQTLNTLAAQAQQELPRPASDRLNKLYLKYASTDSTLGVDYTGTETIEELTAQFNQLYHQRYGFTFSDKALIVDLVEVELISPTQANPEQPRTRTQEHGPIAMEIVPIFMGDSWVDAPIYQRETLQPGDQLLGPCLIVEPTGTNVIEPQWQGQINDYGYLIVERSLISTPSQPLTALAHSNPAHTSQALETDPVLLEIFSNLFQSIAEQMGTTLQQTSYSVNIKERLDFSCAVFDREGHLVANAPHIPVHLGSMGDSVTNLIQDPTVTVEPGDVYASNNPYAGGTHLPDVTVITPVFVTAGDQTPSFYVASRGHHADLGGITPGSMPPQSTSIAEEGILLDNVVLVKQGQWLEASITELLTTGPYPVRNIIQNLADLQAQIAANNRGCQELLKTVDKYGLATVHHYMQAVQDRAEQAVKQVIAHLHDGCYQVTLDQGAVIKVQIIVDQPSATATIDFTGTSAQLNTNFNAPSSVVKAAVLYSFRTLVTEPIPLNYGCLKPLQIKIPEGSMLNPIAPAPVVAGNVETSQQITDCLYGALGVLANSQGTMNNFTFGNDRYQYYETICGGSGAGPTFNGTDAVQTHMTNSRLTDPEVLEYRFPVQLEEFSIRHGSGGQGQYGGGNGVIRKLKFLEPMNAGILSDRRTIAPQGLNGGGNGQPGKNYVIKANGETLMLPSQATIAMEAGDTIAIETPGGGGFGSVAPIN